MTIQEAINKANWTCSCGGDVHCGCGMKMGCACGDNPLLNSSFWQLFGNAMRWEQYSCGDCFTPTSKAFPHHETDECVKRLANRDRTEGKTWILQWHRFIDHLVSGKTAEDFFSNL